MSITIDAPVTPETTPATHTIAYEAARLDRLFPGWHNKINIYWLSMPSPNRCILGQLGGGPRGFTRLYQEVWVDQSNEGSTKAAGAYSCDDFRDDWIEEILKRRRG